MLASIFDDTADGRRRKEHLKAITDMRFRWVITIVFVGDILIPVALFVIGRVFGIESLTFSNGWAYILAPILMFNWWLIRRISTPYSVVYSYMQVIRKIEENQSNWRSTAVKRSVNWDLKTLSKSIARMPASMGADSPLVVISGVRRAAYVRSLEDSVCLPGVPAGAQPRTCCHRGVLEELGRSLELFVEDRWEDLPECEPNGTVGVTSAQRYGLVALGLALMAGAILLAIESRDVDSAFSSWGQLGTTFFVAGSYLAFNKAGLITGGFQQGLDTAEKFNKGAFESRGK